MAALEDVAGVARLPDQLLEEVAAEVHPDVPPARQAAEPEVLEAAVGQVLEGQPDHRPVVDPDGGQAEVGDGEPQVHRRQAGPADGPGHRAVVDPGEDAVAVPALQPRGRRRLQRVRLEVDGPGAVPVQVADDPLEEAPAVAAGGLDEQGDVRGFGMAGALPGEVGSDRTAGSAYQRQLPLGKGGVAKMELPSHKVD